MNAHSTPEVQDDACSLLISSRQTEHRRFLVCCETPARHLSPVRSAAVCPRALACDPKLALLVPTPLYLDFMDLFFSPFFSFPLFPFFFPPPPLPLVVARSVFCEGSNWSSPSSHNVDEEERARSSSFNEWTANVDCQVDFDSI